MSIGSWSPETGTAPTDVRLDPAWLERFVTISRDEDLEQLPGVLTPQAQSDLAPYMRMPAGDWQAAVADYPRDAIWHLMRFLTAAEMHLAGWQAGPDSPVIALNRVLKQRDEPLSHDELLWLRRHSDNRFIPNGPL